MKKLILSLLLLSGCAVAQSTGPISIGLVFGPTVALIRVTPSSTPIIVGGTSTLTAQITMSDGSQNILITDKCTWTTSNAAIASILGNVITGVSAGSVQATCADNGLSGSATIQVVGSPSITVPACATPPCALPGAVNGTAYAFGATATGGTLPYVWDISVGALPAWASISSSTGVISGTPNAVATTNFTIRVTDNVASTATIAVSLTVTAALTGPPAYNGSCSSLAAIAPPATAPFSGLTGAGTVVNDPEPSSGGNNSGCFHNPIVRVTDASTSSNQTMVVQGGGSGDENSWNKDSTLFLIQNNGLQPFVYSFNTSTMAPTLKYSGAGLRIPRGGNFSYTQLSIFYSLANSLGVGFGPLLQQSDFSSGTPPLPTTLFDVTSSPACLPGAPTWGDPPDVSKDDQTFAMAFSTTGNQGTAHYVLVWDRTKGCMMYDATTGHVTADSGWGIPGNAGYVCGGTSPCTSDTFTVHNAKIRKDGKAVFIRHQVCLTSCPTAGASPYIWDLTNPLSVVPMAPVGQDNGGHWSSGYVTFLNNYDNGKWDKRTVPTSPIHLVSTIPTGLVAPFDQHAGWGNVDLAETLPYFTTTNQGNADPTYSFGWQAEVLGIFPVTANGVTQGTVKRFAHCYTRSSPFFNIWNCPGSISPDGKFYLMESPMNNQLGSSSGATTCTAGPTGNCRGDVFIVKNQ